MLAPPRLNGLCSPAHHPDSMLVPARVRAAVAVAAPVEVAALLASAQRLLLLHRTPARALRRRLAAWPTATRWLLLPRVTDRAIAMLVRARVTTPAPTVARETVALTAAPSPLATSLLSADAPGADLPPHHVGAVVLCVRATPTDADLPPHFVGAVVLCVRVTTPHKPPARAGPRQSAWRCASC